MSLQWTLMACVLYVEIVFTTLLVLPLISATRWQKFFRSKFLQGLQAQANIYFYGFMFILMLFFLDSIREMQRYSTDKVHDMEHGHLDAELQHGMKLFRAQRNFYITGFSLFLYVVIRRLVILISQSAQMSADIKASLSQAQSASKALESMMAQQSTGGKDQQQTAKVTKNKGDQLDDAEKTEDGKPDDLRRLRRELAEAKESSIKYQRDCDSMKRQAKSVSEEYDRLLAEYEKLQAKFEQTTKQSVNKKDD